MTADVEWTFFDGAAEYFFENAGTGDSGRIGSEARGCLTLEVWRKDKIWMNLVWDRLGRLFWMNSVIQHGLERCLRSYFIFILLLILRWVHFSMQLTNNIEKNIISCSHADDNRALSYFYTLFERAKFFLHFLFSDLAKLRPPFFCWHGPLEDNRLAINFTEFLCIDIRKKIAIPLSSYAYWRSLP